MCGRIPIPPSGSANAWRGAFGRSLRAVRDNDEAARAFAVSVRTRQVQAFALSGFLAGLGGAVFLDRATLTLTNCTFLNNQAVGGTGGPSPGAIAGGGGGGGLGGDGTINSSLTGGIGGGPNAAAERRLEPTST